MNAYGKVDIVGRDIMKLIRNGVGGLDIGGMGLFNHNSGLILILGVLYGKDDNEGL